MNIEPRAYVLLPTGSYRARVQAVEEAEGRFGAQLRWTFDLGEVEDVAGNREPRQLVGFTSQVLSNRSKLWLWCQAAGLDPRRGIDTEELVGRVVLLDVTIEPRRDGDGEYNAIRSVRRPGPSRPVATRPQGGPAEAAPEGPRPSRRLAPVGWGEEGSEGL